MEPAKTYKTLGLRLLRLKFPCLEFQMMDKLKFLVDEHGSYSVKKAYNLLTEQSSTASTRDWRWVWKLPCPQRVKAWRWKVSEDVPPQSPFCG